MLLAVGGGAYGDATPRWPGNSVAGPTSGATLLPAGGDYKYDWAGNRIHTPGDPNPMVYNDGDQLVRWPGMYRYSYDGAGNLVQVKNDSQTQALKSYTYTPAGLLATATFRDKDGNTRTLTNTWDAGSNRVGMNANGTAYIFVYDPTAGIPAVIEESTSGSTAHYIREPGGALIARLNATEGIRYYHFDELGSTRLLTDANGSVTDRYAYDAYGALLAHDGLAGSVDQPYQYVGRLGCYTHYQEPEFGLLQLGVRFYDAEVGRFTQRDVIDSPAETRYLYASGAPTTGVDPSGLVNVKKCLFNAACWASACVKCDRDVAQAQTGSKMAPYLGKNGKAKPPLDTTGGVHGTGELNAFAHCIRACLMIKLCARDCHGIHNTECYLQNGYESGMSRESQMDQWNNAIGIGVAKRGEQCAEGCYKARDMWSVLTGKNPRNDPTPRDPPD